MVVLSHFLNKAKGKFMLRLFSLCCSTILLTLVVGCGSNVGLKGKVTFSDDGSPVPSGTVAFRKDGKIARGDIKEDGTYVVGFEKEADGLPPGKYEVFISGACKVVGRNEAEETDILEPLIAKKYDAPETSGLTVEVTASTKVFDIKVDRFQGR